MEGSLYFYSVKSHFLFLLLINNSNYCVSVSTFEVILKYFYIAGIYKDDDIFASFFTFYDYCYLIFLERLVEIGYVRF